MYFPLPLPAPPSPHEQLSVPPENFWIWEVPSRESRVFASHLSPRAGPPRPVRGVATGIRAPHEILGAPWGWSIKVPHVLRVRATQQTAHTEDQSLLPHQLCPASTDRESLSHMR